MIYVIGSSNTDMVVRCERLPQPGETVLGGEFICVQGGKGANQAVAAARLGGQIRLVCKVGDDSFGNNAVWAYKKEGIDTSFIQVQKDGTSGVALITVDRQGENSIAVASGTNVQFMPKDIEPAIDAIRPGDGVLLQLEIPLDTVLYAATAASDKGATVILDPAPVPEGGLPDALLKRVDYILPNETEAAAITGVRDDNPGVIAEALYKRGVKHVLITLGKHGCFLRDEHGGRAFAGYKVQAIDSTAAGDAFAGALAVALSERYPLQDAVMFAQSAAALSVTRAGAQPSLPYRREVVEMTSF